jgi:hypothetical protein
MTLVLTFLFLAVFLILSVLNVGLPLPAWLPRLVAPLSQSIGFDASTVVVVWLGYGMLLLLILVPYDRLSRRISDRAYTLERAVDIRGLAWLDTFFIFILSILIVTGVVGSLATSTFLTSALILWTGLLANSLRPGLAPDLQEIQADPRPNDVWLHWTPPRVGFESVIVRRCQDDEVAPTPFVGGRQVYVGSETSFADGGVSPGGEYSYWAFVRDHRGHFSRGVPVFASIPMPPPNVRDFVATPEPGQIVLHWTVPPSPFVHGVRVIRHENAPPGGPEDGVIVFDGVGESFVDDSVEEAHGTYYYAAFTYDDRRSYASGLCRKANPLGEIIGDLDPDAIPDYYREDAVERGECPLCFQPVYQADVDQGDAVLCPIHTYVHRFCWDALGGCPIIGCPHGPA